MKLVHFKNEINEIYFERCVTGLKHPYDAPEIKEWGEINNN